MRASPSLVSSQPTLPATANPLLRRAALDNALSGATRAKAVTAVARMTAPAASRSWPT